ncbi:MAG: alpha/beta fold hydrolase [Bacteroidota bacterium]
MKYYQKIVATLLLFVVTSIGSIKAQNVSFEEVEPFYPYSDVLKQDAITWGLLSVPEKWDSPESNTIKIAVTVLKNREQIDGAEAVVFIQGGPGASGVQNIWSWVNHPLREKNDIVLFDIRGTGFSEPRLCPDLGKTFLEILAKNQTSSEDEKQKTEAALLCKQDLISRGVDINTYNSTSVARDVHALKSQLGYSNWNVYGVSYGTYMAQVYASLYTTDVKSLVLDSSIASIETYYTENTTNFMHSLSKVFEGCKNDPECNQQYPNLEAVFYETIAILQKEPITVSVDKGLIDSEEFTYNAEDFKIAIQQALYNKQLVEVIPLLIFQFRHRNEGALGNLVAAFSSLLGLDYGVYYSVSCNEALPKNEWSAYQNKSAVNPKLKGGLSFYKSDFDVCQRWNRNRVDSLMVPQDISHLSASTFPVLIFSGEYDPITPVTNGDKVARRFRNAYAIEATTYGHVPSFTKIGNEVAVAFINDPNKKPDMNAFSKAKPVQFAKDISINSGISKMGTSLNELNPMFLLPLIIAFGLMFVFIFKYSIKLLKRKYGKLPDRVVRILAVLSSITGIIGAIGLVFGLKEVAGQNYFILAFGLPEGFDYLFLALQVSAGLVLLSIIYFVIQIRKITDRSILFSVIFSNVLLITYLLYWGVL